MKFFKNGYNGSDGKFFTGNGGELGMGRLRVGWGIFKVC